jgi:acetyl esterase/lipase
MKMLALSLALALLPFVIQTNQPAGAALPEGTQVFRDIAYVTDGHARQKLDLYLPGKGTNFPLVVWVHGGAWREGSKDNTRATWLLSEGYAVASINYRLSQHGTFPAQIEDCKAAIRWLRANAAKYGYDGNRIGVWGASAGGHLVALLGVMGDVKDFDKGENLKVSSRVQAICDFFGPTDLTKMNEQAGARGRMDHDAPESPESQLVGGPVQQHKAKAARANPINYISQGDAPFLILHGDQDSLVPIGQSELLHAALTQAKVGSTFHAVKGAGHGGPAFEAPEVRAMVKQFFNKHLSARP